MGMNTGGPAFPQSSIQDPGMTLRDYFAAKAMQACIAEIQKPSDIDKVAAAAYRIADDMLAEREKGGSQ